MKTDDQFKDEETLYYINNEAAKISSLLSDRTN